MPYAQQIATVNLQSFFMFMVIAEMLIAIPMGMILKRMGFSSWWALLTFIPIVALFGIWLLAFVKWPKGSA